MNKKNELFYYAHHEMTKVIALPITKINFYDITLVFSGNLTYMINGRKVVIKSGECLFLTPQTTRGRMYNENKCDYVSFNYVGESIYFPQKISNFNMPAIENIIKTCDNIFESDMQNTLDKMYDLLQCLQKLLKHRVENLSHSNFSEITIKYIKSHIVEKITLKDIAKLTKYSPAYCDAKFKKENGISIINYSLNLKIELAKKYIIKGVGNLQEISQLIGFDDYNYFARCFHQRSTYTPSQFWKMVNS